MEVMAATFRHALQFEEEWDILMLGMRAFP